jgi:regulator of sigma E protease
MGLQDGDNIIAVAGKPIERHGTEGSEMIMNEAKTVTVLRNGQRIDLTVPPGLIGQLNKNRLAGLDFPLYPVVIKNVAKTAQFQQGDIRPGDTIINYDGHPIRYFVDLMKDTTFNYMKRAKTTSAIVIRGHDTLHVVAVHNSDGKIGLEYMDPEEVLGTRHITYTFLQAIPAGIHKSVETLGNYIRNLKLLFTSKEVKAQDSLGSVISIASVFPSIWDWQSFWTLTGIFSILLAFMNVLPIPALDGGHALFTLVEMITGRKPSDKFIEYAQMVGMVLLFGLMIYALGLDIFHVFKFK